MSAPPKQNAAKISHEPSVLRTWRIVATAAPESSADAMPTSCHGPTTSAPGGAVPSMTRTTPVVVTASAPIVAGLIGSPRNAAA
jgi:hypothetical protein